MASKNKKRKAKNSYLINGADKIDGKMKRILYFTKRQRVKNNRIEMEQIPKAAKWRNIKMNIDLSRFKVIHGERVVRALSLLHMEISDIPYHTAEIMKPKFIDVLIINSDGNLEIIHDEAWTFQFVPFLGE